MRNYKNRIIVFKVAQYLSHLQHVSRVGEILTGVKFNYHNARKYARVCEREMERNGIKNMTINVDHNNCKSQDAACLLLP